MNHEKKITVQEFQKRLKEISVYNGVPYGRVYNLFDAEGQHAQKCLQYKGYLALSDAFKSFFLETIESINKVFSTKPYPNIPENYLLFAPHIVNDFRIICGSERLAIKGYPFQACVLLRNAFDNLVLISAALQNIIDFASIEGVKAGLKANLAESKRRRINTEFEVRKQMTGAESGLSEKTICQLSKINESFDLEVHGGLLSLTESTEWMKGGGTLKVLPEFTETPFAMFINRYYEAAWMLHRLLPLIQPEGVSFGGPWNTKWEVIDESFMISEDELTVKACKEFGDAVVQFLIKKFPFNQHSRFPG